MCQCGRAPGRHTARGSGRLVTAVTVTGTVTVTVLPRPGAGTGRGPPARQWRAAAVTVTVTDRDSGPACDGTVTRTVTEGLEHPGPGAARCQWFISSVKPPAARASVPVTESEYVISTWP